MRIIITGATGLIGSAVYKNLKNDGHQVFSFGRNNCDYFLDMNDFSITTTDLHADVIVHCAGVTDEEIKIDREQAIRRNTQGLVNLVDWVMDIGVSQFVYISSAHVYGDLNRKLDEKTETNPHSLYAILHLFAENYIQSVFNNKVIVRPNAVYGDIPPGFKRWELIPFSFPRDLALKRKIAIRSHGKMSRNFISNITIAEMISNSILKSFIGIINPLGVHTYSVIEFANFCVETINKEVNVDLTVDVISKADYVNLFQYTSKFKQPNEDQAKLREHIIRLYRNFKEQNGC